MASGAPHPHPLPTFSEIPAGGLGAFFKLPLLAPKFPEPAMQFPLFRPFLQLFLKKMGRKVEITLQFSLFRPFFQLFLKKMGRKVEITWPDAETRVPRARKNGNLESVVFARHCVG